LELERQLSESLAERDQRIAWLTEELAALKSGHADDRRLKRTSLVKQIQREAELVDMQARLGEVQAKLDTHDELLLSRDLQIGQYEKELTNVRAKVEAKEFELEAVRLRLGDQDQVVRRLMERMGAIEAEITSKWWNEK